MRWTIPVVLATLVSGCAYHNPDQPTLIILPPSTTAASIRLTGSSRPDRALDITATVLSTSGIAVPGVRVDLATSAGVLSATSGVTDGNGTIKSILTTGGNATVSAQAGSIVATVNVLGTPEANTPTPPVVPPLPPVTPTPPALTVSISVAGSPTAGTATTFGLSTQGLSSATWNFGDGGTLATTGTGIATHTYQNSSTAASYTVSVTVTDTQGRAASASTLVTVAATPAGSTTSSGLVLTLGCTPGTLTTATVCNVAGAYNGANVPSTQLNVSWDWGDGQTNDLSASPLGSITYKQKGTYVVVAAANYTPLGGTYQSASTSTSVKIQ